jgi:inosine-uridine nucleoside N-ribohydrolase
MVAAKIWVDTDVALGASRGDVDDGFALAALFGAARQGSVELLGLSTVFGNTSARESERCAGEIAAFSGRALRIVRGAETKSEDSEAADAMAALPDGVQLLCLGPLTNVAAACRRNKSLPFRVSLRAVGGNLSSRGFLPPVWPFEFNLSRDRSSARFVLSRDWRELTLCPLDVVRRLRVGREELAELAAKSPLGAYLARHSQRWLSRARWRYLASSFPVWDLSAALDAIGVLSAKHAVSKLPRGGRRLLQSEREYRFLVSMNAERAWKSFLRLVEEKRPNHKSAGNEFASRMGAL